MPRAPVPFVDGSYPHLSRAISSQATVNMYPEAISSDTEKSKFALIGCPGFRKILDRDDIPYGNTPPTYPTRVQNGMYVTSTGRAFFLANYPRLQLDAFTDGPGMRLYELLEDETVVDRTPTNPQFLSQSLGGNFLSPVNWSDNGSVMVIVGDNPTSTGIAADGVIVYNLATNAFIVQVDNLISGSRHIDYLDGFFLTYEEGTKNIRVSPIDWNGSDAWSALSFAEANQSPEAINGLIVRGGDLFVFGKNSTETWYNAGLPLFPLARNQSISIKIGLHARYSLAKTENKVFFLGSGSDGFGKVYMLDGFTPVKISSTEIEHEIRSYNNSADAYGFTWQEGGHSFYAITFQTGNKTWVYDLTTGLWHERGRWDSDLSIFTRWGVVGLCSFNGKTYTMIRDSDAFLSEMSPTVYDENGATLLRMRRFRNPFGSTYRMFFKSFQVDMAVGVGLTVGQGSNPEIMLRYSNDSGATFGHKLRTKFGKIGEYSARAIFNGLGSGRDRVWEISIADPVPVVISGAYIDYTVGRN